MYVQNPFLLLKWKISLSHLGKTHGIHMLNSDRFVSQMSKMWFSWSDSLVLLALGKLLSKSQFLQTRIGLDIVTPTCNLITSEAKAGGFQVWGPVDYRTRPCHKWKAHRMWTEEVVLWLRALAFQRMCVLFPVPTRQLKTVYNSSSRDLTLLASEHTSIQVVDKYTGNPNIHVELGGQGESMWAKPSCL